MVCIHGNPALIAGAPTTFTAVLPGSATHRTGSFTLMYAFGFIIPPRQFDFDDVLDDDHSGELLVVTGSGLEVSGSVTSPVLRQIGDADGRHAQLGEIRDVASSALSQAHQINIEMLRKTPTGGASTVTTYMFDVDDAMSVNDDAADVVSQLQVNIRDGQRLSSRAVDTFMQHVGIEQDVRPRRSDRPDAIDLPDGRSYVPRRIMGMRDVDMLRAARAQNLVPSLAGPMGSGKTTLAEVAFGDELITANCFGTMTAADLVGQWQPVPDKPGDFKWVDGPLVTAMIEGRPILVDDATFMPEEVQVLLLPVTDHRRSLTVTDRPGVSHIAASDGFCLILASNPGEGYGFTNPLKDRISMTVTVPIDLQIARDMGCDPQLLSIAKKLQQRQLDDPKKTLEHWIPSLRTLLDCTQLGRAFGVQFAAVSLRAECPSDDPDLQESLESLFRSEFGETLPAELIAVV